MTPTEAQAEAGAEAPGEASSLIIRGEVGVDLLEAGEGVLLPIFEDERPLRGLTGLMDWRLHGQLSRLVMAGHIQGALGETCLVPAQGYAPAEHLLLYGLGPRRGLDAEGLGRALVRAVRILEDVGRARLVLPVGGLLLERLGLEGAAKVLLSLLFAQGRPGPLHLKILDCGPHGEALQGALRGVAGPVIAGGALVLG